jgi:hypothetical protein
MNDLTGAKVLKGERSLFIAFKDIVALSVQIKTLELSRNRVSCRKENIFVDVLDVVIIV